MINIKRNRILGTFGFFLVLGGILVIAYPLIYASWLNQQEELKIEQFFEEEPLSNEVLPVEEEPQKPLETTTVSNPYIGILEIPSISLKKGLVALGSKQNDVNQNIQIMASSTMPNIENGNLILAGHSGWGHHAFFRYLYKVKLEDYAYIYYQNVKYIFQVVNRYEQNKDGTITIYRNHNKTTLTLTTCSQTDRTKQIVLIAELVDQNNY